MHVARDDIPVVLEVPGATARQLGGFGEVQGLGATVAALASQVEELARSAASVEIRGAATVVSDIVEVAPEPVKAAAKKAPARVAKKAPV